MITNLSENNSILVEWLSQLRDIDIQQDRMRFRRNIERIGEVAAYEISKTLDYFTIKIETPIESMWHNILRKDPVVATILRAGLPLYQGILNVFDDAESAFVASYRQHTGDSIGVTQEYVTKPSIIDKPLIIADPMLATGSSLIEAIKALTANEKPSSIHVVCVIAAPEGIQNIINNYPDIHIWAGAIDKGLNKHGYITPGLGDAGDLAFGKKI